MNLRTQQHTRDLLNQLGLDYENDPNLINTPIRVEQAYNYLLRGYDENPFNIAHEGLFPSGGVHDLVIVRSIRFNSLCAHHLMGFSGYAHIGYIPDSYILGLSKFARVVDALSHRLQLQERLTHDIADVLDKAVAPQGLGVVLVARHDCMACRGVERPEAETITSSLRGSFHTMPSLRAEFMGLVLDK